MKTDYEYNCINLKISKRVEKMFPELWKYSGEKPVRFSRTDNLKINIKNLKDDFDSLDSLLKNYTTYYRYTIK
jgi:hypothetical protein